MSQLAILDTAAITTAGPFGGTWATGFVGYIASAGNLSTYTPGTIGAVSPPAIYGLAINAAGYLLSGHNFMIYGANGPQQNSLFTQVFTTQGGNTGAYYSTQATYYPTGTTLFQGATIAPTIGPIWLWADANSDFTSGSLTTITLTLAPAPTIAAGHGDITDPNTWQDVNGNIPAAQYQNVPQNANNPLNGDGRFWFGANAYNTTGGGPITFIGNPNFLYGNAGLQWSVTSTANDGSGLILAYSTTTGTWTTIAILPQTQLGGIQSGEVDAAISGAAQFQVQIFAQGGTPSATATLSSVAVAITRNDSDSDSLGGAILAWDTPNPFDGQAYNTSPTNNKVTTDTLANLRKRILIRLGFSNQAANPPPGMAALVNDFLLDGQKYLYRRYMQLHTKRMFRWKVNPGQRFYTLDNNDENAIDNVNLDYAKTVEWVGIQDLRNVWYPMIQGIPPQLYTMITKPWRPARYELRGSIEIYPTPDQTYFMWIRGHFGLMTFTTDSNNTTIDSDLVFLHCLANAKAHYGQPDANNVESQANAYRAELIAGTHQTAHYLPGTIAVPPAVRPTLIQFDGGQAS